MKKTFSKNKLNNFQSGFSLVELMVSLSLFIIVVLALIASLYNVNDASRKVQSIRTVMDNLNFAMESMSRNIRTGESYVCGGRTRPASTNNCSISVNPTMQNTELSIVSTLGTPRFIEYRWNQGNGTIERRTTGINPDGTMNMGDFVDWTAITSPEITIEKFHFFVDGAELDTSSNNDGKHPSVIIKMEGKAEGRDGNILPFAVQTYLSQRVTE